MFPLLISVIDDRESYRPYGSLEHISNVEHQLFTFKTSLRRTFVLQADDTKVNQITLTRNQHTN